MESMDNIQVVEYSKEKMVLRGGKPFPARILYIHRKKAFYMWKVEEDLDREKGEIVATYSNEPKP